MIIDSSMIFNNNTILFGNNQVATLSEGESQYGHYFGGEALVVNGIRMHRILTINFEDPAVPKVPHLSVTVPLFYCFDYRENTIGYFPDTPENMFFDQNDPYTSEDESYPTDDYPLEFEKRAVKFSTYPYDSTNPSDAYNFAAAFGLEDLSPDNYKKVLDYERYNYEMMMDEPPENDQVLLDFFSGPLLLQDYPSCHCINPNCSEFKSKKEVAPFLIVPNNPIEGFCLWGDYMETQVIFEVCNSCGIIIVSNQST